MEEDEKLLNALQTNDDDNKLLHFLNDSDDEFPFPQYDAPETELETKQRFLNILRRIHENAVANCSFGISDIPITKQMLMDIDDDDIKETEHLYRKQVPKWCDEAFLEDQTLVFALTVGRKLGVEYVLNLFDDYCRETIKKHKYVP